MYLPCTSRSISSGIRDSVNITDREKLFDLLKGRKHLLALAGHMHKFEQVNMDETIDAPIPLPSHDHLCGGLWFLVEWSEG